MTGAVDWILDAVPTSDGKTIYFTAQSSDGRSGVFKVDARGGVVEPVPIQPSLVDPRWLAISNDDEILFINADSQIYRASVSGGTAVQLPGLLTAAPAGIAFEHTGSTGKLAFAGGYQTSGVFETDAISGGDPRPIALSPPLEDPAAITLTSTGDAYVLSWGENVAHLGELFGVHQGSTSLLLSSVPVGSLPGLALTLDEKSLFVAGLDRSGHAVITVVDLEMRKAVMYNDGIGQNVTSGGLHRALHSDVMVWVGGDLNGNGSIYRISVD